MKWALKLPPVFSPPPDVTLTRYILYVLLECVGELYLKVVI